MSRRDFAYAGCRSRRPPWKVRSMQRVLRATGLVFLSLAAALTACGGRGGGAVPPTLSAPSMPAAPAAQAKRLAGAQAGVDFVTTTGGATCTDLGLSIDCQGPAGSSATLSFTVQKGFGYEPVSCGPVTWTTRKVLGRPHAASRATCAQRLGRAVLLRHGEQFGYRRRSRGVLRIRCGNGRRPIHVLLGSADQPVCPNRRRQRNHRDHQYCARLGRPVSGAHAGAAGWRRRQVHCGHAARGPPGRGSPSPA